MEDGRWKMEDGRWKMADGRWKMADGRWKMADGGYESRGSAVYWCKREVVMHPETERLLQRTKSFGISVVKFSRALPKDPAGFTLAKQLIRSGTSVGANYREAQRARSKAEFTSKLSISLQEAEETKYWLEIIEGSELAEKETIQPHSGEIEELIAIFVSAVRSAREKR